MNSMGLQIAHAIKNKKSSGSMVKCAHGGIMRCSEGCYANGGEVMKSSGDGIASKLLEKMRAKGMGMAEGGMADDMEESMEIDGDDLGTERAFADAGEPDVSIDDLADASTKEKLKRIFSRR